jgi:hypothetical protein
VCEICGVTQEMMHYNYRRGMQSILKCIMYALKWFDFELNHLTMIRFLITIILLCSGSVNACVGYVVAFRGLNDVFDHKALENYANYLGYCHKTFGWYQPTEAIKFINGIDKKYQLYGFSKGAETISKLLKDSSVKKPEYVLTIGSFRTTDVDFKKYNIKFDNYFDDSGRGQKSPGVFLSVSHSKIQKEVNKVLFKDK